MPRAMCAMQQAVGSIAGSDLIDELVEAEEGFIDAKDADDAMGNVRMGNSLLADDDVELMGEPEGFEAEGLQAELLEAAELCIRSMGMPPGH